MYDNYIELKVEGLTRGRELKDAYARGRANAYFLY